MSHVSPFAIMKNRYKLNSVTFSTLVPTVPDSSKLSPDASRLVQTGPDSSRLVWSNQFILGTDMIIAVLATLPQVY